MPPVDDEPKPSSYGSLILAAMAAVDALRSYQYGNASTELAEEIADHLQVAIKTALEDRQNDLAAVFAQFQALELLVKELLGRLPAASVENPPQKMEG